MKSKNPADERQRRQQQKVTMKRPTFDLVKRWTTVGGGFPADAGRTVTENARILLFEPYGFED